MLMTMVVAPPQKLPSSCNESSIDNVKEGSFCPFFQRVGGSQSETNARNLLEPCNCQSQGETLSSTPRSRELTRPRLQSPSVANLGHCNTTGKKSSPAFQTPDLHILAQAPARGCLRRTSLTPLATPSPTLSSWGPVAPHEILWLLCLLHIQPATQSSCGLFLEDPES